MNYYFLESQYPRRGFISGGTTFTPELDMNYLAIENPLPEGTTAEVELLSTVRNLKVDYFETITGTRHVSDRFKALLEETNTNTQFIPTTVCYHDGRSIEKTYWTAHQLDRLDVFDYENSEYGRKAVTAASVQQPPRKIVKVVSQICLHEERIGEHEFFMLDYINIFKPIISKDFYEVCRKHKLNLNVTEVGNVSI
ncbi:imm11 family protein [Paenibacillus taichungensis]|uniref:imm11 family protein n=1 Tax=Paenibacillus taichungensis TaxID=484184 RepID=UPI0035DE3417